MRFCPFCSAENSDELAVCQACGRRLPPLPPRRSGSAPPTGVQLSPRPAGSTVPPPPRRGTTLPPAIPRPSPMVEPPRESAPALPPPPIMMADDDGEQTEISAPPTPEGPRDPALWNAIHPGPAAQRAAPSNESRIVADRRRPDSKSPPPARSNPPSQPPPIPRSAPPPPMRPPTQPPAHLAGDTFITDNDLKRAPDQEPPPTRIHRPELQPDRPFTPPKVLAVPEIPEPGLVKAARYAYTFALARWQRRGAIKQLGVEIKQDTEALDQVLGALGRAARGARVEGRVFSAENAAINAAEERIAQLQREHAEVEGRKIEENSKFVDVEHERNEKLTEAERMVDEAQRELGNLEGQRRTLRDKRKELERRQKAYLKAAEDHDRQAGSAAMGDQRQELRRVAEGHRREAAALEPDRQEIDRRLGSLERPISEVMARLDAGKAELDAAKRSLNDAREGHTHRLAELDAEQKRKTREVGLADSEIQRRLVTLGTLVNLNRVLPEPGSRAPVGSGGDVPFAELYMRIDRLRGAITARTTEIEKLTAEREAYDRGTLVRGVVTIGGAFVALIALIVILRAIL